MRAHVFPIAIGFALAVLMLVAIGMAFSVARAHDDAAWIMDNPATSWCCGPHDCAALEPGAVEIRPEGAFIRETGETIPFGQAKQSIDSRWWRCKQPSGATRCLFQPDMGS